MSLNVSKTHCMILTARNKTATDLNIKIYEVRIERVYEIKFLVVLVDSHLTWKQNMYDIHVKSFLNVLDTIKGQEKVMQTLSTDLVSFICLSVFFCNQVWGNNYQTVLNKLLLVQKKLVRIITCSPSPFRAHMGPLIDGNNMLSVDSINTYLVGIFIYQCYHQDVLEIFLNLFQKNGGVHG